MDEKISEFPEVISRILSFISYKNFLELRLVSKLWDQEVLKLYHRKKHLFLHVRSYFEEESGNIFLPEGSNLTQRLKFDAHFSTVPRQFFMFLRQHERNVKALSLEIDDEDSDNEDHSFVGTLLSAFQRGLCPTLKELYISALAVSDFPKSFEVNFSLPSLKILDFSKSVDESEELFFLMQIIVDSSPNLEELGINDNYLPSLHQGTRIRELFVQYNRILSSKIPDLGRLLKEVSSSLRHLVVDCSEVRRRNTFTENLADLVATIVSSEVPSAKILTHPEVDCDDVRCKFYENMVYYRGVFKVTTIVEEDIQEISIIPK